MLSILQETLSCQRYLHVSLCTCFFRITQTLTHVWWLPTPPTTTPAIMVRVPRNYTHRYVPDGFQVRARAKYRLCLLSSTRHHHCVIKCWVRHLTSKWLNDTDTQTTDHNKSFTMCSWYQRYYHSRQARFNCATTCILYVNDTFWRHLTFWRQWQSRCNYTLYIHVLVYSCTHSPLNTYM